MFDLYHPSEEHQNLREMVRAFTAKEVEVQAREYDQREEFNIDLFRKLGPLGLLGVTVPVEFGGSGMDAVAAVIVHEELSYSDPAFCLAYLAHSMLFANNLSVNGNDDQRQRYLPNACSGNILAGMCMSEPGGGTDVLGMTTLATKEGDNYRLCGRKIWITNGALNDTELGDLFLVYAKDSNRDGKRLSLFIVEKGWEGFSLGHRIKGKLGMRASTTAELVFDDVLIPAANRIGSDGEAVRSMMRNLEIERLTLAAMSLGIARRCIEVMNDYARERQAFGKTINRFGQIQAQIADSYAEYMAGRAYVYSVASSLSLSRDGNRIDSDGVKLYCARMAKTVADRAIQVLGGNGYVAEYNVERLWRDAKLNEIGGGTNEAHQKNMTNDLAKRPHLP